MLCNIYYRKYIILRHINILLYRNTKNIFIFINHNIFNHLVLGIGDWGLGIGDWARLTFSHHPST
ncbi:MAG: hypothetical protein MJ252_29015, partial [archaeon]|nr:hypothetical protein [archaeon]